MFIFLALKESPSRAWLAKRESFAISTRKQDRATRPREEEKSSYSNDYFTHLTIRVMIKLTCNPITSSLRKSNSLQPAPHMVCTLSILVASHTPVSYG